MKSSVILTVKDACSGTSFRYSGQRRPDTYIFTKVPGMGHLHRLTVSLEEWRKIKEDILQQPLPIPIDVDFQVEFEPGDADATVTESVRAEVADLTARFHALEQERDSLLLQKTQLEGAVATTGETGITDEQKEMLEERDAMLEVLGPLAKETETPLECLQRVAAQPAAPKPKAKRS